MIKAVIFDLDGTLVDSLRDLADAMNSVLRELGFETHEMQRYKEFVGNGVAKLIERAIPQEKHASEILHKARIQFDNYYKNHSKDHTVPYEDILKLLELLKCKGIKIAVVTNKPDEFAKVLVRDLFGELIDYVVGQQIAIPPKPDPTGINYVQRLLAVKPEECLYIGDSDVDIHTAKNARTTSVGVLWGFRERQELVSAGADYVITTPLELLECIRNHQNGQQQKA